MPGHAARAFILSGAALASVAAAQTQPAASPAVLIHAGTVLLDPSLPGVRDRTIVVRGGRIEAIREGFVEVPGATVIDLRSSYILPGLIDAHVHLDAALSPSFELDRVRLSSEDNTLIAARNAYVTLQAGFTTVRNLGGGAGVRALRDAAAGGRAASPRIVDAGQGVSTTAGHGDVHGYNEIVSAALRAEEAATRCDGADDCARATREAIRRGADVIKISSTGGVMSNVGGGLGQQMSDSELGAVVRTAHMYGRKVAVHAHAKAGIDAALRAGADSIEHGSYADGETVKLLRASRAYLVPTLLAPTYVSAEMDRLALPPASVRKAREATSAIFKNIGALIKADAKLAFGTDSGVSPHGQNARELKLLVDAGMSPRQAIVTATTHAADLLGLASEAGSIAPGKSADIIAVESDPLRDVTALERVTFVMARGTVFRREGAATAFVPK